jgi:hypothetical protein
MMPIHNRMPVILESTNYDLWLDPTVQKPELLQPLLKPYNSNKLKAYPVSALVNNPRHDSVECLELIEIKQGDRIIKESCYLSREELPSVVKSVYERTIRSRSGKCRQ